MTGIVVGVIVVLIIIIAVILGVIFGLKAKRAKKNSVNIRRNVYDDKKPSRRAGLVVDDSNSGMRHSQLLI